MTTMICILCSIISLHVLDTLPYGNQEDRRRLYFLNALYLQSWASGDTQRFDQLLWANDFIHQSGSNGHLMTREATKMQFGADRFDGIDYFYGQDEQIRFVLEDVALVIAKPLYKGKNDKEPSESMYNDVYVKRNGQWKCVSANVTGIYAKDKPIPECLAIEPLSDLSYVQQDQEDGMKNTFMQWLTTYVDLGNNLYHMLDDSLMAPDFILLDAYGRLKEKSEVYAEGNIYTMLSNKGKLTDLFIRQVSPQAMMVHYAMRYMQSGIRVNDIYVLRNGQWQCVSRNETWLR